MIRHIKNIDSVESVVSSGYVDMSKEIIHLLAACLALLVV